VLARQDRVVLALAIAAMALAIAYGIYLAPEWDPSRDDKVQYVALARGLVDRGEFTRATASEPFIPEPLRFPGYPLFLAPLCIAGCPPWLVTIAQALLLGALVLQVARLARPLVGARGARVAAGLVALNPAYAFFAAHTLSDLLATVLGVATVAATIALAPRALSGVAPGAIAAAATLTRPFLIFLLPLSAFALLWRRGARAFAAALAVAAVTFVIAVSPYVAYTERAFGRPVAGSTGAQLWLGYFQGLDERSLDPTERAQADAGRAALARFDATDDRVAQAQAFVALDDELRTRALTLIAHDPQGFLARGVTRSVQLWAGDVPVRPEQAGAAVTATWVLANLILLGVGLVGAARLVGRGGGAFAIPLLVILATWVLSYPLWAEGRFSLPARPFLGIGVAAYVEDLLRRPRV
jgi:4-amino-4-deoxy-L-arabinose transferase-like glycosyltransferase